jgi:hypothetical protein
VRPPVPNRSCTHFSIRHPPVGSHEKKKPFASAEERLLWFLPTDEVSRWWWRITRGQSNDHRARAPNVATPTQMQNAANDSCGVANISIHEKDDAATDLTTTSSLQPHPYESVCEHKENVSTLVRSDSQLKRWTGRSVSTLPDWDRCWLGGP